MITSASFTNPAKRITARKQHATLRITLILLMITFPLLDLRAADVRDALPDFSALSLQELSTVKVTSVSKKQQKLSQVAAAVYVISQEEIHRSGRPAARECRTSFNGLTTAIQR